MLEQEAHLEVHWQQSAVDITGGGGDGRGLKREDRFVTMQVWRGVVESDPVEDRDRREEQDEPRGGSSARRAKH
jgi:hypothetical protein